jgi:CRISPR type I-E-associated protein CasB/Cse2
MGPTQPQQDERATRSSRATVVHGLMRDLGRLPPGDLADLRRLRPGDIPGAAFFRLAALHFADRLPGRNSSARDEAERRWSAILGAMAHLEGLMRARAPFGHALAEAGVSELRVLRLFRAHGEGLEDALRAVVHQLVSRAVPVDPLDIARLVLSDGRTDEESVRRRIAREFYSHEENRR